MAYDQFGKDTEMIVQDSSSFAEEGERVSFLQVQVSKTYLSASTALGPHCLPQLSLSKLQVLWHGSDARQRAGHAADDVVRGCVQARAMAVKQVLVGFYDIPKSVEQPLQLVINPEVHIA